jgi:hypothetical protein
MSAALRQYIRILLEDVMGEPDQSREDTRYDDEDEGSCETDEASGVGAIAGAITPMGTSATYPNDPAPRRRKKTPAQAAGSAFGGAMPYYMGKRKKR